MAKSIICGAIGRSMMVDRSADAISRYLSDESNAMTARQDSIAAVYFPESEADIAEAVRTALKARLPITVSGAGTGITGSRVPMNGGIVLSMEKMLKAREHNGCREIIRTGLAGDIRIFLDETKSLGHVAPGVSISELAASFPRTLMYPPDPTETSAFLGGTCATNASGARCFHYGPTRKWIAGLRMVLPDSEIIDLKRGECFADTHNVLNFKSIGGKRYTVKIPDYRMPEVKNAAGLYSKSGMDVIDLIIGSEGILGIISEMTLQLVPAIREPATVLAFFRSEYDAQRYADSLRAMNENGILAIEYFDRNALDFIRPEFPELRNNLAAAVLSEVDAESLEIMSTISDLLESCNAAEDWCATTSSDRRDMKEFRHSLPDAVNTYLKQHDSYKIGTDFVVPSDKFPAMMAKYRETAEAFQARYPRPGAHSILFGHIGDCHLHFNFITSSNEERAYAKNLYLDLAKAAISMGGTISGEHGVGKKTLTIDGKSVPYLQLMYGESGIREITRVKKALDPGMFLNAGNMIPAAD